MKKTLIICIALILMSNIFAQQENTKDFNYWYDQFIEKQKEPFMDGRCEGFKLGNIIWQRYYGEKEYFLSPMFSDSEIKKYYDRIKRFDDKKKGILKSQTHFIKVELNKITISLLSKFLINVPDYIHDKILVRLPEIDIDMLMKHNCNF
ncbi:MAG: hypothetical protein H8D45_00935, partial [Bacteroidetes bacterium]|nr:hypothetical protein [Bacteroidota bacterium]